MGIGYISRACKACDQITLHIHGISVKGTIWYECTICGRYEKEPAG